VCIIHGKLLNKNGTIKAPLTKNHRLMRQKVDFKNGKEAVTHYKVL
jgi:23S rRNA-/tRNA-specific pseudouridylate synthase